MSEPIVTFDEKAVRDELEELVRKTVEDTLSALLEEEADDLIGADRHERTAEREAYRAGHYERGLTTTSGQVTLRTPKLKGMRFATAIIERHKRRETSVEEAMIEMCPAGVPTRGIEDVSEIPWGSSVSAATASNLSDRAFEAVEERGSRPLAREHPYVLVDGICLKGSRGGSFENAAVMAAIGVNDDGCREVIGAAGGFAESARCRRDLPSRLRGRGLSGARLVTGDRAAAMAAAIAEAFPDAACQGCTARFCRNALSKAPETRRRQVAAMLKAIHARESLATGVGKAEAVADSSETMELGEAARCVRDGVAETLAYTRFPMEHRRRIRANNAIERLNREIGRRTRVVGTFPDGKSALVLVAARLKCVADSEWGSRRYLDVSLLDEWSCRSAWGCSLKVRKTLDSTAFASTKEDTTSKASPTNDRTTLPNNSNGLSICGK